MAFGGAALKFFQTALYAIEFCCAAIILGIYSYFLSVLADRNAPIYTWVKAVEGMSGAAVLYTIFAVLLTCCLGGKMFFAFLAIVLDILFCAAFIALAVLTRHGAGSCSGTVNTPLGTGPASSKQGFARTGMDDGVIYSASLGTVCRLNTACFAVAIIGAFLFLISAFVQLALGRHHKKEKRFGPSPANNYTRGSGVKFWQRKNKKNAAMHDPEMAGAVPATGNLAPGHHDVRPSHDTAYTGTTAGTDTYAPSNKPINAGYHTGPSGYQTAPTGTYGHAPATNY